MAIKEKIQKGDIDQKIPSPSEVAKLADKSPKKFTEAEINKIKQLQAEMNQVIYQLGQLKMNEIKLEKSRGILESKLNEIEKKETDLAGTLNKKYGRGTLDIDSGEFIPSK